MKLEKIAGFLETREQVDEYVVRIIVDVTSVVRYSSELASELKEKGGKCARYLAVSSESG